MECTIVHGCGPEVAGYKVMEGKGREWNVQLYMGAGHEMAGDEARDSSGTAAVVLCCGLACGWLVRVGVSSVFSSV